MDKKQFINELVDALAGEVPSQVISENVNYYRNYLAEESAKTQRSEKEIIEELGSPRLIARSIIDAYQAEHGSYSGTEQEKNTSEDEPKSPPAHSSGCGIVALVVIVVAFLVIMTVMRVILSIPGLIILIVLALVLAFYRSSRR